MYFWLLLGICLHLVETSFHNNRHLKQGGHIAQLQLRNQLVNLTITAGRKQLHGENKLFNFEIELRDSWPYGVSITLCQFWYLYYNWTQYDEQTVFYGTIWITNSAEKISKGWHLIHYMKISIFSCLLKFRYKIKKIYHIYSWI